MDQIMVSRKNEFEILILVVLVIDAIALLLSRGATSASVNSALPGWWLYAWVVGALIGCVSCLIGIFHRNFVDGVYIERSSVPLVCVAISAIATAQIIYNGVHAVSSAVILYFIVLSFIRRHRKLTKVIRDLRPSCAKE